MIFFIYFIMKKFFGKLMGVKNLVSIDFSFLCLLILSLFLDSLRIYFFYVVFIFLHEMMHFLVAKKLGYLPKKLKLSIFGASLEGFDDFLVLDEIKIILAGPIFHLAIVVVWYLSFWFYPESYEFLIDVLTVNKAILLFNILPIFPLDFGRLFLCLLSIKRSRREGLKIVKKFSVIFVVAMFVISLVCVFTDFGFSLGFASINLFILIFESSSGTSFKREILLRKKIERLGKGVAQKVVYVNKDYSEKLLLKFLDGDHYFKFVFVDENFSEIKTVSEFDLLKKLGFI